MPRRFALIIPIFALALAFPAPWPGFALAPSTAPVKLGMPQAMFRDVPPSMFSAVLKTFYPLVESQTGLKSEVILVSSPDEMRQQLNDGKLQFGVFHGFEFAWMKQKDPNLKPVMVAAPVHRPLKAYVVVASTSPAKSICDLRGKRLALPNGTREHSRIFVDRQCQCQGNLPSQFFEQITTPNTAETALHD